MSILFHHYKELKECTNQVEQIEDDRVNSGKKQRLMKEVKKEKEEIPNTIATITMLHSYLEM